MLEQIMWPLQQNPKRVGKNYAVDTGFLAKAGSNCYAGIPANFGWHTGWDINGATSGDGDLGLPITPILDGVVVYAGRFNIWGNIVVVRTYDGAYVRYAHMREIPVKVNQHVIKGVTNLGGVGKGGGSFVAHLHMDIWLQDFGNATRWNGGLQGETARVWVDAHYWTPKLFFANHGMTNIQHAGGCPL